MDDIFTFVSQRVGEEDWFDGQPYFLNIGVLCLHVDMSGITLGAS